MRSNTNVSEHQTYLPAIFTNDRLFQECSQTRVGPQRMYCQVPISSHLASVVLAHKVLAQGRLFVPLHVHEVVQQLRFSEKRGQTQTRHAMSATDSKQGMAKHFVWALVSRTLACVCVISKILPVKIRCNLRRQATWSVESLQLITAHIFRHADCNDLRSNAT